MSRVPAVRFEGFTDPWEQRKLGEVCSFAKGRGYSKADVRETGTPLILYGRLYTKYQLRIEEVDTFADVREDSLFSKGNEVIVPASGETAEDIAVASSVRSPGIMLGGDLNVVTPSEELEPDFLALGITHGAAHTDLAKRAQGKSVVHIHNEDISDVDFAFPGTEEQTAISTVVLRLDSLITLHQRKYEKLCVVKKSLLDKMFPKPGELYPEIRFEGFTDPWEQRKLGELMLFQNGFNGASDSFGEGVPLISVMDVLPDDFITYDSIKGKARVSDEEAERYSVGYGDILFQRSSENYEDAGTSNVYLDQQKRVVFGGFVIRGKKIAPYAPEFMRYSLHSKPARRQITRCAQGAQHINVSQDVLQEVVLPLSSLPEQRAIGSLFSRLDSLITLHQRKLELLKNLKAACLDKMFV